ncbi:MAG: GntR family transcriptional regulator [Bradyrhizobium sp.]|uniref:GntR family transcriptional regulator n=1 Tax=Bradyrhizobium sp. TaxID=376 RepID=UPI002716C058|nr:GntR family transcriptional regulator [Bradyrhizobium sp.]MDO8396528.1 GntR family transcriptional regulator [Bradyrhizobium sp.]
MADGAHMPRRKLQRPVPAKSGRSASHIAAAKETLAGLNGDMNDGQAKSGQEPELNLADCAYRALEEMICTLELPPGTRVSESSLVKRLGIGRTPVREALQRLSRDGLVVVLRRHGVLVSEIDVRTQLRIIEVRRVLESLMARLAAERAAEDEIAQFAKVAAAIYAAVDANDDLAFVRLDTQLNELLARACGNRFASGAMNLMIPLARRFWYRNYKSAGDMMLGARLHAEIADAIARRNPDEAEEAVRRLLDYIDDFSRKTLDR